MSPFSWPQVWQTYQFANFPGAGGFPYRGASGTTNDRAYGKDIPFFWSEVDLRGYRVTSRFVAETNPFAIGFCTLLVGYHVRKGYGWQACRKGAKKTAYPTVAAQTDELVERAQRILDTFRDQAKWRVLSREAFYRWRVDGEVFLRLGVRRRGEVAWARFVEPEQVGAPDGSTADPWSYGIDVLEHPDGTIDPEQVLAYHVWDLESGMTAGRWVDSRFVVHAKANVVSGVKRGRPDFFPLLNVFDGVAKLVGNMLLTAVDQAAIAWLEKFPTATAEQVRTHIPQQVTTPGSSVPAGACAPAGAAGPWWAAWMQGPGGGNRFRPGTIYRTEGNREIVPRPDSPITGFLEVEKLAVRAARMRWNLPGSASGDAEDTTFAAAIQAGGPFPVAVEGSQVSWADSFERPTALAVLDLAVDAGLLDRADREALDVEVTEPAVVTPEPDKDTARNKTLYDAKVLSPQTWQLKEGLDPQHEAENWKAFQETQPQPQPGGSVPAGNTPPGTPPDSSGGGIFGEGEPSANPFFGKAGRVREDHGPPPFPGAVFDTQAHRWKNPHTGETHPAEPPKAGAAGEWKSPAQVEIGGATAAEQQATRDAWKAVLPSVPIEAAGALVGAPEGAKVRVRKQASGNIAFVVTHPEFDCERVLSKEDGRLVMENQTFEVKKASQGKGIGADVFSGQVEACKRAGVSAVECDAAGPPLNGYYTWPRLGYDQPIGTLERKHPDLVAEIRHKFPAAKTVLDVMVTQEGRDFWKARGVELGKAKFDLADGSRSLAVMRAYRAERKGKSESQAPPAPAAPGRREEIALSADQEAALERAWARVEKTARPAAKESVLFEGFTGTITDSAGRHRHYVDGKQVAAPAVPTPQQPSAAGTDTSAHERRARDQAAAEHFAATAKERPRPKHLQAAAGLVDVARRRRVIKAVKNEGELAEAIDGHNLPDSEPADVLHMLDAEGKPITDPFAVNGFLRQREEAVKALTTGVSPYTGQPLKDEERDVYAKRLALPAQFIEVKTLLTAAKDEVHVNAKALARKERWVAKYGVSFSVVVLDDRRGGKNSGHRTYVLPHGVGRTIRLDQMEKAADLADVRKRIDATADQGRKAVLDLIRAKKGGAS